MKSSIVKLVKNTPPLYAAYVNLRDLHSYYKYWRAGTFSQHGEDKFLREWFGSQSKGFYLDIGASHPFRISNTYALYRQGWRGIVVDPIPHFKSLYSRWRSKDEFLNAGIGADSGSFNYYELTPSVLSTFNKAYMEQLVAKGSAALQKEYMVEIIAINDLFKNHVAGRPVDFMTIDVEGLDLSIISAMNFELYRPKLISVEFNTDEDKVKLVSVLTKAGYDCSRTIGCNIFAVDAKLPADGKPAGH